MTVAFASTSQGTADSTALLTISHTVAAGQNRGLFVFASCANSADNLTAADVKYGGENVPFVQIVAHGSTRVALYYLADPVVGTADLVFKPATAGAALHVYATTLTGVHATTPYGALATKADPWTALDGISVPLAVPAGGMVLDLCSVRKTGTVITPAAGQTLVGTVYQGTYASTGATRRDQGAQSAWTWPTITQVGVVIMAVPVNPADGAGPSPADGVTWTGPTVGAVGTPSGGFSAGLNGAYTGSVLMTPNDGGGGGAFTPASASSVDGAPVTFQYTPGSTGAKTLSLVNDAGLDDSGSITFTASASAAPVAFAGTVPAQTGNVGAPFSLDLAPYFSGTRVPFTYALQAGSLAGSGLTLTGAVISGTPTAGVSLTGLAVQATDTGAATASTNAFSITVAAVAGFDFHTAPGIVFGDLAGALTGLARQSAVGIVARAYSASTGALVATSDTLTTSAEGRLPRWANAGLAAATQYVLTFTRVGDGEVCATRMTAT